MKQQGQQVRLIAPRYVQPFNTQQKNDAADAEAIVEAALRPTVRFVEPKTATPGFAEGLVAGANAGAKASVGRRVASVARTIGSTIGDRWRPAPAILPRVVRLRLS
jgi:hypothetical protein